MKYYNIDLTQFVPYGIPLNSTDHVESRNHINAFFLHGFERWYNQLFTLQNGVLVQDYSRSCSAPYSLSACKYCTDNELEKHIKDAGFVYYSENDHDINAKFVYDLSRYPHRTKDYLTSIAQYISNNINVDVELVYDNCPEYEYDLRLYGDIIGSADIEVMLTRLLNHLTVLSTAHTRLRGVEFIETSPEIDTFAACVGDNSCIYYESIIRDFKIEPDREIITYSAIKAPHACTYYESEIKEVKPEPPTPPTPEKPDLDTFDPTIPFCIENMGDTPVVIDLQNNNTRTNVKFSFDLDTWEDWGAKDLALNAKGDRVYLKADRNHPTDVFNYLVFVIKDYTPDKKIRARGNIASLDKGSSDLYKTDYLTLSAASGRCYYRLFDGCKGLIQAPELPATTLVDYCYASMFYGCTALTQAPKLPSSTLAEYCYSEMFENCTSLTQAPELACLTLVNYCYCNMFRGCTSLTKAPKLPASTLAEYCYFGMFNGCTLLNHVECLAADISAQYCTNVWLGNVSPTGNFFTSKAVNWSIGVNGIPSGWTRYNTDEQDYIFAPLDKLDSPLCLVNTGGIAARVRLIKSGNPIINDVEISRDNLTWTPYEITTDSQYIDLNAYGDKVFFRGNASSKDSSNYIQFITDYGSGVTDDNIKIKAYGNVNSILNNVSFSSLNTLTQPYCLCKLFNGCKFLVKSPILAASKLSTGCYIGMFTKCSKLNYIKCLATSGTSKANLKNWVYGVSKTGDFYKDKGVTIPGGVDGIPSGWTVYQV